MDELGFNENECDHLIVSIEPELRMSLPPHLTCLFEFQFCHLKGNKNTHRTVLGLSQLKIFGRIKNFMRLFIHAVQNYRIRPECVQLLRSNRTGFFILDLSGSAIPSRRGPVIQWRVGQWEAASFCSRLSFITSGATRWSRRRWWRRGFCTIYGEPLGD